MAAAKYHSLTSHEAVLAAAKWAEWLHPRGLDGRFIEIGSMVDIFSNPGNFTALDDPGRERRRGRIVGLYPDGAEVEYFDGSGVRTPAEPGNGYPSRIPLADIKNKVSSAPNSKARLPSVVSSREEFNADYRPALDDGEYQAQVGIFNKIVGATMNPSRSAAVKDTGPLTEGEFEAHQAYVTEVTDLALGKTWDETGIGLASDVALKDSYGRWSDAELQRMLVLSSEIYAQVTAGKPKNRRAIMLGGLPGVGKSTLLNEMDAAGTLHRDEWVEINPDLVKDEMIARGLYPKITGLTPAETAGFIHAQSSEIAAMMERMAMNEGYNLVFDTTLGKWAGQTIEELKVYGYADIDGIYIDANLDHSIASINYRHMDGLNKYRTGKTRRTAAQGGDPDVDNGGRFVPTKVVTNLSGNKKNFERLKADFNRWALFEVANAIGEKPEPELVDSTGDGDLMPGAYPPAAMSEGLLV